MPSVPPPLDETKLIIRDGRSMIVERFASERVGPAPAVVLLHGADGLTYRGPAYRGMARQLAERGLQVYLPHYFERSDETGRGSAARSMDFLGWMDAVTETLAAAGPGPTGLVGVSLGAYAALAVAGRDERVGAVVAVSGGLPAILVGGFTRMPPVLVLHGDEDRVVPPSEARALATWLTGRGTPHEVAIYPGEGHHLTGKAGEDALKRTTAFLQRYLRTE